MNQNRLKQSFALRQGIVTMHLTEKDIMNFLTEQKLILHFSKHCWQGTKQCHTSILADPLVVVLRPKAKNHWHVKMDLGTSMDSSCESSTCGETVSPSGHVQDKPNFGPEKQLMFAHFANFVSVCRTIFL